jgi:TonB family protein
MPARALLIALLFLTVSPQAQPRLPVHVESLNYPPLARKARIQGTVVFEAQIAADGTLSVPIIKSGHPTLVHVAEENLKKWKFQPGEDQQMEITYHFKLREPTASFSQTECQFDLPNSVTVIVDPPPVLTTY